MQSTASPIKQKFNGLSTLEGAYLDSNSDTSFPIASISKSFFGAVCALMSLDGEFGEKGIEATLSEILIAAKEKYPTRKEAIDVYLEMLEKRNFSDVKISELLNHTSGCRDADEVAPSAFIDRTSLDFFSNHLGRGDHLIPGGRIRGEYHYSNVGYILAEEIVNLTSGKGSYLAELKDRVITPLGLRKTGVLEDGSPQALEADSHLARAVFIPGSKASPHTDEIVTSRREFPANYTTPLGAVSASCGGLCASPNDLKKFYEELSKAMIGQPSLLSESTAEFSKLYRQQLGDSSFSYSLGIIFKEITLDDGAQRCLLQHTGNFPGNYSSVATLLPISWSQLNAGETSAEGIDTKVGLQKSDYLVSSLFTEQSGAISNRILKDFLQSLLTDEEKPLFADKDSGEIEKFLITKEVLPIDFAKTKEKIFQAFNIAGAAVKQYLIDNYLTPEGIINSAKIAENFTTIEDVDAAIGPILGEATKIADAELKLIERMPRADLTADKVSDVVVSHSIPKMQPSSSPSPHKELSSTLVSTVVVIG